MIRVQRSLSGGSVAAGVGPWRAFLAASSTIQHQLFASSSMVAEGAAVGASSMKGAYSHASTKHCLHPLVHLSSLFHTSINRQNSSSAAATPTGPPPEAAAPLPPSPSPSDQLQQTTDYFSNVRAALDVGRAPSRADVHGMLLQCGNEEDVERMFQMLAKLRLQNASLRGQLSNFDDRFCLNVVHACIRAGAAEKALVALSPSNPFGLSPLMGAAHVIMRHAAASGDSSLLVAAARRLLAAKLMPSAKTADIMFRALHEAGQLGDLVAFSRRFQERGVSIHEEIAQLVADAAERTATQGVVKESPNTNEALAQQ